MKFEIIGSGGCVSLPKPLCRCKVCEEARSKGRPYSRYGPSMYVHDTKMLIDTPEDICHAINDSTIESIASVAYSHMDPDHVLGFRLFEQLRLNWFDAPCDVKPFPKSEVFRDADVMIIGNTVIGESLKGDYILPENSLLKRELFDLNEIIQIRTQYNIKQIIMTHLEEDWGKSYDDYKALEKDYDNLRFAFDGMIIDTEES